MAATKQEIDVVLMHQLLRDGAERTPDKIALRWVDRDRALTFSAAVAEMERFAGALHHLGVRKGDRVTVFAHNGLDYLMALFACWRIGAIAALVNVREPRARPRARAFAFRHVGRRPGAADAEACLARRAATAAR
jgi:acyl-CoA synthetase (AMP-forming)/AMP-acid ligase II